jgi:hypothetical protein
MTNGKQVSVMGITVARSITVPSPKLIFNIIMAIYTYIPEKNCNMVQAEADVAIMSLNPSIANYQTVDFCISRKKKLIHEDAAAKTKSPSNKHYKSYSTRQFLMPNKMSSTRLKIASLQASSKKFRVTAPSFTQLKHKQFFFPQNSTHQIIYLL